MLKHLKTDLINATLGSLINEPNPVPEYVEQSVRQHKIADGITKAIDGMDCQDYLGVVQGLFEGGFLSTEDRDFSTEQLWKYIYGVKVAHSVDAFIELHTKLTEMGMTDHDDYDKRYNPSGDNYYSAYTFDVKPDEIELKVAASTDEQFGRDENDRVWDNAKRRVVVVENQSPMFAYILEDNVFGGEPENFIIVQLKREYNQNSHLDDLIECEFDISDEYEWSAMNDTKIRRILTTLKITEMKCEPIIEPRHIEYSLFNIYSGRDSLEAEL